ncbi:MAG TPA: class I SAM-dependent methyltransferase, partial [Kofleriaceae bacterium]
ILEQCGAERVDAFDLDPDMVDRARRRLARFADRARVFVGDAERIPADANTYDAVFDFGIIHHIPSWRNAVAEVHRVLKPGGRFYSEEVLAKFINHPVWSRVLDHPKQDRFDQTMFGYTLEMQGFTVVATRHLWGQYAWFVADKRLTDDR